MIHGKPAEFEDPIEVLSKNSGREVTRVESVGVVKIQFVLSTKNMDTLGFQIMK
tara:strand:+ start:382 stop:543 length:162 start_codon:yes stop_codon:yes gene_type:complete